MNNLFAIIILIFTLSKFSIAKVVSSNLRKCVILPVDSTVKDLDVFKTFRFVEEYIKDSSWCYYKYNSSLMDILGQYRTNLGQYLTNKKVLSLIAEKSKAGSLISLKFFRELSDIKLKLKIIGENGEDIYFKREKSFKETSHSDDFNYQIKRWLEEYATTIPYDAIVKGRLEDQVIIDIGEASNINVGQSVRILKPIRKKIHPLLNEIVEWETKKIAEGKIKNTTTFQSMIKITKLYGKKDDIKKNHWVRVDKAEDLDLVIDQDDGLADDNQNDKKNKKEQGRLCAIN